jgi:hypothetical protein
MAIGDIRKKLRIKRTDRQSNMSMDLGTSCRKSLEYDNQEEL